MGEESSEERDVGEVRMNVGGIIMVKDSEKRV